jgi:hypothetical protein
MDSEVDLLKNHLRILVSKSKELEEERLREISTLSESLKSQSELMRKMESQLQAFQNQAMMFQQRIKTFEGHMETQKETIQTLSSKLKESNDANTELIRTNEVLREKLKRATPSAHQTMNPPEKPSFYPKTPPPSRQPPKPITPKTHTEAVENALSNSQRLPRALELQQEIEKITQESEGLLFRLSRSESLQRTQSGESIHSTPKHSNTHSKPSIASVLMQTKPRTPERNLFHEFIQERPKTPPNTKPALSSAFPSYPNAKRNSVGSKPTQAKPSASGMTKKKPGVLSRK